jgi:hypothetical protein
LFDARNCCSPPRSRPTACRCQHLGNRTIPWIHPLYRRRSWLAHLLARPARRT